MVVIPLPVQVILSIKIVLLTRNIHNRRNPFTGSGHSFSIISLSYCWNRGIVVIPLPVQVILSKVIEEKIKEGLEKS